jgi:hypothetical protein
LQEPGILMRGSCKFRRVRGGPKIPATGGDFFRQPLSEQINLKHPFTLLDLIDWDRLGTVMTPHLRGTTIWHDGGCVFAVP